MYVPWNYVHTALKTVHGELHVGKSEIQTRTL